MPYWNHDYGWGWVGLLMMIVAMVVFWGGLVTLVVVLVRRFGHTGPARTGSDAERILDERFARGEIDQDELKARRAALRGEVPR